VYELVLVHKLLSRKFLTRDDGQVSWLVFMLLCLPNYTSVAKVEVTSSIEVLNTEMNSVIISA